MKYFTTTHLLLIFLTLQTSYAQPSPASFAYLLQAESFAKTKENAVTQFKECGRDWLVLDADFSRDNPWTRADLETIRSGHPERKIIAYISIGEAEDYRSYWRKDWGGKGKLTAHAPSWLGKENPAWKGNYQVKFWNVAWQELILANVDAAIKRGFDGIYLDIVDAFETFEKDGDKYLDNRINPETKQSYRRDMVDWVTAIATRARAKNPNALVIPQNGSQLVEHADFLKIISGIGIEDLFTHGDKKQPESHTNYVLSNLKNLLAAKKPALIIEYPTSPELQIFVKKRTEENQLVLLVTDRELKTLGVSKR